MTFAELVAKITIDSSKANKELDDFKGKFNSFGSAIKSGLGVAVKTVTAGVAAGTAAVTALTKQSVDAYANYEQMVGGIQKLYGNMGKSLTKYAEDAGKTTGEVRHEWENLEIAQNRVLSNANKAYETAGMSATKYMEVATSFSAALINSLGGDTIKAADMTDTAMTAIADNWNTFGGDLSMIQGAFQGFAKQNYTMLDNLKLGYGGTKTEMERLIKDANTYAKSIGEAGDMSINSFADIVRAIDLIQQKQNIAGTTQREAATTISGSLGMVKAAWENLVTGFADADANLDMLIDNVVKSASTFAKNVLPAVEKALSGVGTFITEMAPIIADKLPELVEKVIPNLVEAGSSIVSALAKAIISSLPTLIPVAIQMLLDLGDYINDNLDKILNTAGEILGALIDGIIKAIPKLAKTAGNIVMNLATYLGNNFWQIVQKGVLLIASLAEGIAQGGVRVLAAVMTLIGKILQPFIDMTAKTITIGADLVKGLWNGIKSAWSWLVSSVSGLVTGLVGKVKDLLGIASPSKVFKQIGTYMAEGLSEGWNNEFADVKKDIIDDMNFGTADIDMNASGKSFGKGAVSVVQNIYSQAQTAADLMQEALYQQEKAVMLGV